MNRKGSIMDIIIWLIVAFVTLIFFGIIIFIYTTINSAFMDVGMIGLVNVTDATMKTIGQASSALPSALHLIAFIILAVSAISILIHNFLVKAHPAFFVTYIFIVIAAIVLSAYISNHYVALLDNAILGPTLRGFTAGNFIMTWLPLWTAIIGIFGTIFLFIGIIRTSQESVIF